MTSLALCMTAGWITGCGDPPATPPSPPQVSLTHLDRPQVLLIEEARDNVVASPDSPEAWGHLGRALNAVEFNEAARACYQRAMSLDPNTPHWPYLLGLLQLQDNEQNALANLNRAVAMVDVDPDAPRLRLARFFTERGRNDEARPHLERLLAVNPHHAGARLEWARIQISELALDRALQSLGPCLTNQYTARPAMMLLAQVWQRQGQTEDAARLARQAGALPRPFDWPDPYLRDVLRLRIDRLKLQDRINGLLMRQQFPEAATELNRLLRAFPEDPEGSLLMGRMHLLERHCAEAETALRQHLSMKPESLNGLIQLSLALLCQQRWDDATSVLQQALELKPDFAEAHYNLGYAHARAGHSAAAMQSYTNALRCNPGYVDAHTSLAEELYRSGATAEAEVHRQKALKLDPNNAKARGLRP